jgi:hypothetical protein
LREDKIGNVRTCDLILRSVCADIGVFAVFGKLLKNCAITRIKGKSPLGGNAAKLVVHGNISLTINIALNERVTEFISVVRSQ